MRTSRRLLQKLREPATEAAFPAFNGPTQLFINNRFVPAQSGRTFPVINPGNGDVITNVSMGGKEDVNVAVQSAHDAFYNGAWGRSMSPRERGECLYKLADLIKSNQNAFAAIESLNNGKTLSQSMTVDTNACATILRYYAGWADKITGHTMAIGGPFLNYTRHDPVGVCALIVPWNLPLIALAAKIGPALCCGNTVVLKTAEQTPLTALMVAELVEKAGFPPGVVNIISGDGPTTGEALTSHPLVDKISFTGSVDVGRRIQRVAADTIKRVTLELGGNNPIVVCKDADLDVAVNTVHNGLFWNKGEACAAGSRIFIHDAIYDEFVQRSVALAKKRVVGNPFHSDAMQGAQVTEEHMHKVQGYIQSAIQQGAKLETGGKRIGTKGNYLEPTVFSNVKDDMKVWKDEVFGPVLTLGRFSDTEDVIRRANATEFGLACGVFTKSQKTAAELIARIRSGMTFWNCYHVTDISAPFGGVKQSGLGREGGHYGLLPYLEVKNIVHSHQ